MAPKPKAPLPPRAGAGFRTRHCRDFFEGNPRVSWLEVHPENYMVEGGPRLTILEHIRSRHPISFHGLALSLAGAERPDKAHLKALKGLIERFEPAQVTEHIAWSALDGHYFPDLLPVPFTKEALEALVRNIGEVQEALGRRILVENPALYLELPENEMTAAEFISETVRESGCGLLLDLTNLYISGRNLGAAPDDFLAKIDPASVGQIHLAGYSREAIRGSEILIDSHSAPVADPVWKLFEGYIGTTGPKPTLVEWDNELPAWPVLEAEVKKADEILVRAAAEAAA